MEESRENFSRQIKVHKQGKSKIENLPENLHQKLILQIATAV